MNTAFWRGKKVLLTGHTGFKGAWLSIWLCLLGAEVIGLSLEPPTKPNLFALCKLEKRMHSILGDIRSSELVSKVLVQTNPDIIVHLAAQALVRESYRKPIDTFATNIMGTVNILEAARKCSKLKVIVNVTTDKCYENKEWVWGYRESDALGGYDPYSSSKACSELVTASYGNSFFNPKNYSIHGTAVATARAGNVIGGGDWAQDRLVPDCIDALLHGEIVEIRNPRAIRPWQHVLEPLYGYLLLAQQLYEYGPCFAGSWNFGPDDADAKPVEWIVQQLCRLCKKDGWYQVVTGPQPHEATYLRLDCSKAKLQLGWKPHWDLGQALVKINEWYAAYQENRDLYEVCAKQIAEHSSL